MSEKEQEVISIWGTLSLPVVQDFGLQNILGAYEMQRDDWTAMEVQDALLGLNKIYELLLEYHRRESHSVKTNGH